MRAFLSRISSAATLAAIGGGLASALLSVVATQATFLAQLLGYLAPLPIMLAALSFGGWSGWVAAVTGTSAYFLFGVTDFNIATMQWSTLQPAALDAGVYALELALPSWCMACLAASVRTPEHTVAAADERKIGLILACAAAFSVVGIVADILAHGGFTVTIDKFAEVVQPYVQNFLDAHPYAKNLNAHKVAVAAALTAMPMEAGASLLLLCFNVWLAARVTRASGRFAAPWPDLARSLRMPRGLAIALAAALGLSFAGGVAGLIAMIAAGALVMGFATQGLALIHDVTRGESYRLPLLVLVYMTLALLPWLLIFYAAAGLSDAGFSFRGRPRKPVSTGEQNADRPQ